MRPSDLTFRGEETLPVWAATLVRQLASGGSGAPPDVLSPVPLVEEVISIIDGLTQGHEPAQRADLCSLRDDLMLALEQLGSATKDLLATTLRDFRAQSPALDAALRDVRTAVAFAPLAHVFLEELSSCETRAAAFSDCVDAFRDLASADDCELRLS